MLKRILIVGAAGRGKSTFAARLSAKTGIPHCSTDDFYWKVKFTEKNDKSRSIEEIKAVYLKDVWIVDGTSRHLIADGLESADIIFHFEFKHLIFQYYFLITRFVGRKHERFIDLWDLLKYVTNMRFGRGSAGAKTPYIELLKPYEKKVVRLDSMRAINAYLESFN